MFIHHFPLSLQGFRPTNQRRAAISEIRRTYVEAAWARMSLAGRFSSFVATAIWPLVALTSSIAWQLPRHGSRGSREGGRPLVLQLWDQMRLALEANMWPRHYYMFELYRAEHRRCALDYLLRHETKRGVFTILKDAARKNEVFARKDRFAAACSAASLSHVPVIAVLKDGNVTWHSYRQALPPSDLFVKPVAAQGGRGAERWRWRKGVYEKARGDCESAEGLLQRLQQRSRNSEILVSPCVVNHPAFEGLALGALSTLRILTCRNERDEPETVAVALRFPRRPNAVVDNFHAGGLAVMVDLPSGRLGVATDIGLSLDSAWHKRHPVTDAPIEGFAVPFLAEATVLAEAGHRALGDRVVVGWDIAVLPDGPALIEANSFPDLDIVQRCGRSPLGGTRFCELIAFHLRRRYPIWRWRHGLD
jgi:hypothetical protein